MIVIRAKTIIPDEKKISGGFIWHEYAEYLFNVNISFPAMYNA